jgi:hypothetical protein
MNLATAEFGSASIILVFAAFSVKVLALFPEALVSPAI